jgi:hypothetical protein
MVSAATGVAVSGSSTLIGTNTYNSSMANRNTLVWASNLDPKQTVVTGSLNVLGTLGGVAFSESGQWALAGGSDGSELQVIDTNSRSLIGRVVLPFGARINEIKVRGNLAYIAAADAGLIIVDLGLNGRAPVIVGSVDTMGGAISVDFSGKYAYVADTMKGLQVVDVSNPQSPVRVGAAIPTVGDAQSVRVQGQYLYLAQAKLGGSNGLVVFDLANPAAPASIGTVATPGYAGGLDVAGNLVYLASGSSGLVIVDVSNPRLPVMAKILKTFGQCRDVKASGGLVYLADDSAVQATVAISPTP